MATLDFRHLLFRPAIVAAAIIVVPLAGGCASQPYLRSYTYDYTPERRLAAERRAIQDMQDACYLSGALYFEREGSPEIVTAEGPAGRHLRVTQSYSCVGTQGGP